ncbi:hypothetical protein [Butyrivibrio sp. YAB3001]|uniref:hypothetical protein n=1 Tax=Butyrivibrio sp. YAB3001 TaxID=1520812 RepID=UPI0008F625A8|nr:hypothetical protein [Butyrivibrio sp. YAB3001]SFB89034.1 hypothetical protein SAMN02910398_01026 [Butyrivibrio sp. YAB3001]
MWPACLIRCETIRYNWCLSNIEPMGIVIWNSVRFAITELMAESALLSTCLHNAFMLSVIPIGEMYCLAGKYEDFVYMVLVYL